MKDVCESAIPCLLVTKAYRSRRPLPHVNAAGCCIPNIATGVEDEVVAQCASESLKRP